MKKLCIALLLITVVLLISNLYLLNDGGYLSSMPDVVPNEETAVEIARSVIDAVYDKDIEELTAEFNEKNNTWTVSSALPEGSLGGIATVVIKKGNGRVVEVHHSM